MYLGIIFTLLVGLSFLIGINVLKNNKYKSQMSLFTIALAFVVLIGLLTMDLLPELLETKNTYLIIPFVIGFLILIILDKLIPHHHHEHADNHCDKKDHALHLNHIGIITIVALAIHNLIEGLSLYMVTLNDLKSGFLMMIGISLHNIPLGFQIGNSLKNKEKSYGLVSLLCLSSLFGALIAIIFGNLNELVISILLALTFGMLLYILIFELFNEIKASFKKKEVLYGIIIGIIIVFITNML